MKIERHILIFSIALFAAFSVLAIHSLWFHDNFSLNQLPIILLGSLIPTLLGLIGYFPGTKLAKSSPETKRVILCALMAAVFPTIILRDFSPNPVVLFGAIVLISFLAGWRLSSSKEHKQVAE